MEFKELNLKGVFEITLMPHVDERGFFMRTYDIDEFRKHGLQREWVQENHSRSERKGIIRGLHFQIEPYSETKLVRCVRGGIFDVAVDLRKGSKTFGKWEGIILSEENKKMFFIPRGFAHGFCTLSEISEVLYKVDNYYSPEHERGLIWNDPDLNINWPVNDPILSVKDQKNFTLKRLLEHG
ncbi:MAG: dTDP-4-dehydrorhamnose 3,5-epimerase [Bacteroidales bacterium]|jgi:dTDP-4-dehydrorhamnose 3,5-epimerase|nr:dTDP-4-dehydrorhamnose 3,5-epimerase [Bacteroidales bacterium]